MSTDLSIILKITAQNDATPILEKVTASLKETGVAAKGLTAQFDLLASATTRLTEGIGKLDAALLRLPGRFNDSANMMRANIDQVNALASAYGRLAGESGRIGGTPTMASTGGAADRSGGSGYGFGQQVGQLALYGGAFAAYSGIKASVGQAIDFNATAASTQATTGISSVGLQQVTQGIMSIAASGNSRYDANTLLQGAYAIISTGVTNPQQVLAQLRAAAASATAANATDVLPSTSALTTVMNAYGASTGAMKYQDIISMAINQGKADPTQVPTAMATFARSARTAGVSFSQAAGAFAFDTLASRDAQTSGQDMDALFRLVNNPNMASRTFAKNLPGLDWGTGMVQRAGGLDPFIQNVLAKTAGPNQGLLLSRLFNNAPALAAVEGVAADPGKFSQYLADAGGTGTTTKGAQTFMASDAGKLFGATNELKTEFQKFSTQAIPLLTSAVQMATAGISALGSVLSGPGNVGGIGDSVYGAARTLEHFITPGDPAFGNMDAARLAAGADMTGPSTAGGRTSGGTRIPRPLYIAPVGSAGGFLSSFTNTGQAVANMNAGSTTGVYPSGLIGSQLDAGRSGATDAPTGAAAMSTDAQFRSWQVRGAGAMPSDVAQYAQTAYQAQALAVARRTSAPRKTGDMTAAGNALQLALAVGASPGTINQMLSAYISAVNAAGLDPATAALDIHAAQASVTSYNQGLASTAAATAATATSAGYQHVQAALQVAQITHQGVASATAAEASFIRAHPTLWNNDPTQLQLMLLSLNQQSAATAHAAATGPNLIRPNLAGLGALQSGAMATAALYGRQGGAAESKTERNLEAQLAAANETIAQLRQQLRVEQDQLGVLRDSYEVNKQMLHVLTPAAHAGNHVRRPHANSVSS